MKNMTHPYSHWILTRESLNMLLSVAAKKGYEMMPDAVPGEHVSSLWALESHYDWHTIRARREDTVGMQKITAKIHKHYLALASMAKKQAA